MYTIFLVFVTILLYAGPHSEICSPMSYRSIPLGYSQDYDIIKRIDYCVAGIFRGPLV